MSDFKQIAHLDFKGLQQYSEGVLHRLKLLGKWGYDAILVEYEDVFPYREHCFSLSPKEKWSSEFLTKFLQTAADGGLEVIPLQQTLGHMEYALRWDRYATYRLDKECVNTLDITSSSAKAWLFGLLEEMISAHPESKYMHLGMDEAAPLIAYASTHGKEPLRIFLDYLDELCRICEKAGRIPVIWSDMLEDYLGQEEVEWISAFRDRVILACWDYTADVSPTKIARFGGRRISRYGLEHPEVSGSPKIKSDSLWMEDWPPRIQKLTSPYRVSEQALESLFPAGIWKDLGFRVWGAGAASPSEDGPLIPLYHRRMANLDRWREVTKQWNLDGLIVTAWARSQTCCAPGIMPDLQMPMFCYGVTQQFGSEQKESDLRDFFLRLGRCREGWAIEDLLIEELEELQKAAGESESMWALLICMLRIQSTQRAIQWTIYRSERYLCGDRLPAVEWEERLAALEKGRGALEQLREPTRQLLTTYYFGEALEEWFASVFDDALCEMDALTEQIHEKKKRAAGRFSV